MGGGEFERAQVHHGNGVLVFEIHIHLGAVDLRLFGGSAEINRADNGPVLGVQHGDIGLTMAEYENAL